jgi:hypothetical protein
MATQDRGDAGMNAVDALGAIDPVVGIEHARPVAGAAAAHARQVGQRQVVAQAPALRHWQRRHVDRKLRDRGLHQFGQPDRADMALQRHLRRGRLHQHAGAVVQPGLHEAAVILDRAVEAVAGRIPFRGGRQVMH